MTFHSPRCRGGARPRPPGPGTSWPPIALGALLVSLVFASPGGGRQADAPAARDAGERTAVRRAETLFDSGEERVGELAFEARLILAGEDATRGTVEALVPVAGAGRVVAWIVLPRLDRRPQVRRLDPAAGAGGELLVRAELELPEGFLEAAVVVEDPSSGRWGAAVAEFSEDGFELAAGAAAVWEAPRPAEPAAAAPAAAEPIVLRILPPDRSPAVGRTRIRILVSDPLVARVDFLLDGEPAGSDESAPFGVVLDLGPEPRERVITAIGTTRQGYRLGEDRLTVNASGEPFRVRIERVAAADDALEIAGRVSVPAGSTLAAVEVYLDQALVARPAEAAFEVRVDAAGAGPSSFVRVVARLADGSEQEDARLLSAASERLEVNLVELYAVVTGPDGKPVRDLRRDEVAVHLGNRAVPIERFGPADQVPLALGLVIDTSQSMEYLMEDTKVAGTRFLADTLRPGDRAFLVDFDTRPKLAHPATDDLLALLRAFGRLRPDGFTALYDAIIFSMLQFEGAAGRRALVLLTDGDDYRSRFGQGRCIDYGRDLGVPVYILGLGGILDPRGGLPKIDLEGIVAGTGGRIFYITDPAELDAAYAEINAELRNQYLIAFATERELTRKEVESLRVELRRKGHDVRTVVTGRRIDS